MQKLFLLIVLLVCFAACKKDLVNEQPVPTSPVYDFSAIDKILSDSVPVKFGGNCYAMIQVDGQTVYTKSYGGYTGDTRQLIASCTKWLSAAVLLSMVEEGKIALSDSVGKYLPLFTAYGKGRITIAQLFSHTSGLPGNSAQGFENNQTLTLAQAVDSIAIRVPLLFTPGSTFYYGGVSMHVAGRICEVVSGKSWAALVSEKITGPCGMTSTDYGQVPNPIIAGGGRSTPNDYIKLLEMLRRKGLALNETRVLSEAAVDAMEQPQTRGTTAFNSPYPVGLFTTDGYYGIGNWRDFVTPADALLENSSPGAFGSHPWINRNKKICAIIFTYIPVNGYISTLPTCLAVRAALRNIVP